MEALTSSTPRSVGRKHKCGAGAKARRQDKHRTYMNTIFEEKRDAALAQYKLDLDYNKYIEAVHDAMVSKKPELSPESYSVEIDESVQMDCDVDVKEVDTPITSDVNTIVSGTCGGDKDAYCASSSMNPSVNCVYALPYAGSGYVNVPFPYSNSNVTVKEVESFDSAPMGCAHPTPEDEVQCKTSLHFDSINDTFSESVLAGRPVENTTSADSLQVAPNSPKYAPDSPVDSDIPLKKRRQAEEECNMIVCSSDTIEGIKPVGDITPVFLHPQKYSVVIFTAQTMKGVESVEEVIESFPLTIRHEPRAQLLARLPKFGHVFTTTSISNLRVLRKLGFSVIAHLFPVKLAKVYKVFQPSTHRLRKIGVMTFLSVNHIDSDLSICTDIFCLLRHRGRY